MKAHFFDLDTLINIDSKAWVITKSNPSKAILKITKSDFNIIKSGLYRSHDNQVDFNGNIFWLPNEMMAKLMVIIKNDKLKLSELAISLREFMDVDYIDQAEVSFDFSVISKLKNTLDDIYIICPVQLKKTHTSIIEQLTLKLTEFGIAIKMFYHISETFYDQTSDVIEYKKMKLFVQHLLGYKTSNNKMIDEEIERYECITYYGSDKTTLSYADKVNQVTRNCVIKSDDVMQSVIKEDIIDFKPHFIVKYVTDNEYNKIITKEVSISMNSYIQSSDEYKKRGN
jgi:hypothetical protein